MTLKEKAKDKRLQKKYGWTLSQYKALLELQDGKCGICGRVLGENANVDHEHFQVPTIKTKNDWLAWSTLKVFHVVQGKTKAEAIAKAKQAAMPLSVRGLLCPGRHYRGCNRLLGRVDNVQWLEKAIAYLQDPPARRLKND